MLGDVIERNFSFLNKSKNEFLIHALSSTEKRDPKGTLFPQFKVNSSIGIERYWHSSVKRFL